MSNLIVGKTRAKEIGGPLASHNRSFRMVSVLLQYFAVKHDGVYLVRSLEPSMKNQT